MSLFAKKIILYLVMFSLCFGGIAIKYDQLITRQKMLAEKEILIKWGRIDGKSGPVGELKRPIKVEKNVVNGKPGYYVKFSKGTIVNSKLGTYYMSHRGFNKWLQNANKLGFPISDPQPNNELFLPDRESDLKRKGGYEI